LMWGTVGCAEQTRQQHIDANVHWLFLQNAPHLVVQIRAVFRYFFRISSIDHVIIPPSKRPIPTPRYHQQ
jgi:hypothetical protein